MAVMRPRPRTIFIQLKHAWRLDTRNTPTTRVDYYIIEQLRNAASIEVGPRLFRVNDEITPEEADQLCETRNYEVTINN